MGHFVRHTLQIVRLVLRIVVSTDIMRRRDCTLTNVLRHQKEVVHVLTRYTMINNSARLWVNLLSIHI